MDAASDALVTDGGTDVRVEARADESEDAALDVWAAEADTDGNANMDAGPDVGADADGASASGADQDATDTGVDASVDSSVDARPDVAVDAGPPICTTGCAVALVPGCTDREQIFIYSFGRSVDLTDATVTFKFCAKTAPSASWPFQLFVQNETGNYRLTNGPSNEGLFRYAGDVSCDSGFRTIKFAIRDTAEGFTAANTGRFGVEFGIPTVCDAAPMVVYLDSVTFSGPEGGASQALGPFDFETKPVPWRVDYGTPIEGAEAGWLLE